MSAVSLAKAKEQLSALVDAAEAGQTITITRRGRPAAKLVPVRGEKKPVDISMLRELVGKMPYQEQSAADLVRAMRDDERY